MAYACDICGKGKQFGHNVPFSQKKTAKVWKPNLQTKRLVLGSESVKVKICTQCMRTLEKYRRAETANLQPVASDQPDLQTAPKPKAKPKAPAKKTAAAKA